MDTLPEDCVGMNFDIKWLDYGALGAAFGVLAYALHMLNKVIRMHEQYMDRLIGVVDKNATANTKLSVGVNNLVEAHLRQDREE